MSDTSVVRVVSEQDVPINKSATKLVNNNMARGGVPPSPFSQYNNNYDDVCEGRGWEGKTYWGDVGRLKN